MSDRGVRLSAVRTSLTKDAVSEDATYSRLSRQDTEATETASECNDDSHDEFGGSPARPEYYEVLSKRL